LKKGTQSQKEAPASRRKSGKSWQLQAAKARFSEVFQKARVEGPQTVTRQGKEAVVIIRVEEFERLIARSKQPESLSQFFAQSPLAKANLNLDYPMLCAERLWKPG
jgi:prevent-host-death family protein